MYALNLAKGKRTAAALLQCLICFGSCGFCVFRPKLDLNLEQDKEAVKKLNQQGDNVGFQPTIAHHYVFHVYMGRSWRWPPYRHRISEHPRYDKASLGSDQADQKLIHSLPRRHSETTIDLKQNVGQRSPTIVWTIAV
ncbi:hypothetical protein PoB_006480300 [Plakobranchus ocellatus]|uniref:Uncharacterized protein n=1 Tax=Plakobranchus ocellatus TaxID=259542 RepID=A0AAV4D2C7_9GAST|nr:hypothetical protein PoB_006480300 [Plakobranchus ocellatus]